MDNTMTENEIECNPPQPSLPSFQRVSRMCLVLTIAGIALIALGLGEHITGEDTKVPITTDLHYHLFWAGGFVSELQINSLFNKQVYYNHTANIKGKLIRTVIYIN